METKPQNGDRVQFFTIAARNYLAYAFVLGESVLRTQPDAVFSIFLMDDLSHEWKGAIEARGFGVIYPEDIPLANYRKFVFQYNITEASTGVKPSVFQMFFNCGAEKVIYLDPDILCFRRFDEVLDTLDQYSIVLTPHICSPVPKDYFPGDKALISTGVFNLGFLALRRDAYSTEFLSWWSEHLSRECVQEPDAGFYVDQKWIDLVPMCFERVHIMRNLAYNVAYWNLHERNIDMHDGVFYESNSGERVAFMHFSGFAIEDLDSICRYPARNPFSELSGKRRYTLKTRADLVEPFQLYKRLLIAADNENFSKIQYAYANYRNGEPISQLERSLFLSSDEWFECDRDPFCDTGPHSFRSVCRKAGVRTVAAKSSPSAQQIAKRYSAYFRMIEFLLKCCLRVLGPQVYLNFAKYMRHQLLPLNQGFLLSGKAFRKSYASGPATNGVDHSREASKTLER